VFACEVNNLKGEKIKPLEQVRVIYEKRRNIYFL
jgi:hypothetical protein